MNQRKAAFIYNVTGDDKSLRRMRGCGWYRTSPDEGRYRGHSL